MSRIAISAALFTLLMTLPACESDTEDDPCGSYGYLLDDNGQPPADKKMHGERCAADDECAYGICYKDSMVTNGQWGICTKVCSCGDETSRCEMDDPADGSYHYICFRPPIKRAATDHATDSMSGYCVPACTSNGDAVSVANWCAQHDPAFNTCETPAGVNSVCTVGISL